MLELADEANANDEAAARPRRARHSLPLPHTASARAAATPLLTVYFFLYTHIFPF